MVGLADEPAKIGTIYLGRLSITAKADALQLGRHRLTQLVRQHEGRLVLAIQVAGRRERRLALDLVAEDGDRREVVPEWHLVPCEQGAAGDAEILPARLAAPTRGAIGLSAIADGRAAAVRTDQLAVCRVPADVDEGRLDFLLRHAQDRAQGERPGLG